MNVKNVPKTTLVERGSLSLRTVCDERDEPEAPAWSVVSVAVTRRSP